MNIGTMVNGSGYQAPELRPDQRQPATLPDDQVLTEATHRGAVFSIVCARHAGGRCACEFEERNQRDAQQRCNPEGACWMLLITFPQGSGVTRHICANHAAKTAARVGLAFPPNR